MATNGQEKERKKRGSAALKGVAGVAIAFGGLAFAIRALFSGDSAVSLAPEHPILIAAAVVVGLFAMGTIGVNWWVILRSLSAPTYLRQVITAYYPGQLGKYLPGGLWPIVGRGELLYRGGTPRSVAYASVAISLMLTYLAAAVVALPVITATALGGQSVMIQAASGIALLGAIAVVVHPRVFATAESIASRFLHRQWDLEFPPWHITIAIIATSTISWVLIGLTTWIVAAAYAVTPPMGATVSATALSWLIGFLIIPVPGGIGVREAAFIAVMPGLTETGAALLAISSRVVFVAADVTGAVLVTGAVFIARARIRSTKSV